VHAELAKQSGSMYQCLPIVLYCNLLPTSLCNQVQAISVKDPKPIYLANVNARAVRTARGVAKDLADNIAYGVRWHDATAVACDLGCELFLEVPPGHALSDLARENLPGVQAHAITCGTFDRLLDLARS
jgi:malonate decarboxylase epsilon subunit